jgi:hypothetical protein
VPIEGIRRWLPPEVIPDEGRLLKTPPIIADGARSQRAGQRVAELALEEDFEVRDLFALIDSESLAYAGMVRLLGYCDHQPEHSAPCIDAALVAGRLPERFIAVGPLSGALKGARMRPLDAARDRVYADPLAPGDDVFEWQPMLQLDLDGDGTFELEQVIRCVRGTRPGCPHNACEDVCVAVRAANSTEPKPAGARCESLLRDVYDACPMQPEDHDGVEDCDGCPE